MLYVGLSNYPALLSSASLAAASITEQLNSSRQLYQIVAKIISREMTYRGFFS